MYCSNAIEGGSPFGPDLMSAAAMVDNPCMGDSGGVTEPDIRMQSSSTARAETQSPLK